LLMAIKVIHQKSRENYGSPRIHAELNENGYVCSKHRVSRLMNQHGIISKHKRKFKVTTNSAHSYPVAGNLLQRRFDVSGPGEYWDNAVAESFFHTLKVELIHGTIYNTRQQARTAIFEYIEVFYNRQHRHFYLSYLSPVDFEKKNVA